MEEWYNNWSNRDWKTVVVGGNGAGNRLDQLNSSYHTFVDQDRSVYVSNCENHRAMKWMKGAKEGIVIVGGNGSVGQVNQFNILIGLSFDRQNSLYVGDHTNHRVQKFHIEMNSNIMGAAEETAGF